MGYTVGIAVLIIAVIVLKILSRYESRAIRIEAQTRVELEVAINKKLKTISKLTQLLHKCNMTDNSIQNPLTLLNCCLDDSSLITLYNSISYKVFESHIKEFINVIPKEDIPKDKEHLDLYVKQQLSKETKYKAVLSNLRSYDYKTMKKLYNQYQ